MQMGHKHVVELDTALAAKHCLQRAIRQVGTLEWHQRTLPQIQKQGVQGQQAPTIEQQPVAVVHHAASSPAAALTCNVNDWLCILH
jgi:hypothetical protein